MSWIPQLISVVTEIVLAGGGAVLLWKPQIATQRIVENFPVAERYRPRIAAALTRRTDLSFAAERFVGIALLLGATLGFLFHLPAPLIWAYSMGLMGVAIFFEAALTRITSGPRAAQLSQRSLHDVLPWQIFGAPLLAVAGLTVITDYGQKGDIIHTVLIGTSAAALATLGLLVFATKRAYHSVDPAVDAYVDLGLRAIASMFLIVTAVAVPLWTHGTWPLDNIRDWIGFAMEIGAIVWVLFWGLRLKCLTIPIELQCGDRASSA